MPSSSSRPWAARSSCAAAVGGRSPRHVQPAASRRTSAEARRGLAGHDKRRLPTRASLAPDLTEIPEPAAGRLVRLRARLARSESTLGRGLLALLSRDTLDDETWQEVEDLLLTADVGVSASNELVDSLRTKAKVLGTRSAADATGLSSRRTP